MKKSRQLVQGSEFIEKNNAVALPIVLFLYCSATCGRKDNVTNKDAAT
jgi:hypothetical protein